MPESGDDCSTSTLTTNHPSSSLSSQPPPEKLKSEISNENNVKISTSPPLGPLKSLAGSTFVQYREEIYKKLKNLIELCRNNYKGHKELATDQDDLIVDLCETLEEVFSYGLKQQQAAVVITTAALFQNMQEIITGNIVGPNVNSTLDTTFWDFCQMHLTKHEKDRFEALRKVWTKHGKGKAFIRAALNENSLQRYLLIWLYDEELLRRYYTSWSLLLNEEVAKELPKLIGTLETVLFAITFDKTELNAPTRFSNINNAFTFVKEEPIIEAPEPIPVVKSKQQRHIQIETPNPIIDSNGGEPFSKSWNEIKNLMEQQKNNSTVINKNDYVESAKILLNNQNDETPTDPIEPELEFLKEPLEYFCIGEHFNQNENHDSSNSIDIEYEDKSDSSSQYSKSSSSANGIQPTSQAIAEPSLQDMTDKCAFLETRVAKLTLENRQLVRKLTQLFKESGIDPNSSLSSNYLITIPQATLVKSRRGSSYYTYEIHITMRRQLEHWSVSRRYRDFYKLHKSLLRTHPIMSTVDFPPKKHFGNMNTVFVEERRQQLQIYLINLVEHIPQVEACKTKAELQKIFPFLRER